MTTRTNGGDKEAAPTKQPNPIFKILLILAFAALGYWHLTHGSLVIGGFAWWACGVNCAKVVSREDNQEETPT